MKIFRKNKVIATDTDSSLFATKEELSGYTKNEQIAHNLSGDYYYCWMRGSDEWFTTTDAKGATNIDVFRITFNNKGNVTAIEPQETKGSIVNGTLSFNGRSYSKYEDMSGYYTVDYQNKVVAVAALDDVIEKSIKINDVEVSGMSMKDPDKVVRLKTVDNLEDNFYYAFKNGSNYYYTKSKASGSTTYYEFTYTENVLTKITSKGSVTVSLDANGVPQITVSSTIYTLDETKNDYYIVNAEQILPSAKAVTQDLTANDLNRIFEGFYLTPPNPTWKYVGILSASNGSTIKVEDDWTELLLVMRVSEGASYFNLTSVLPKYGFTYGSPNGNNTFAGFYWNESYNCKMRVGLEGSGTNRNLKLNYLNQVGWALNGTYVFKR